TQQHKAPNTLHDGILRTHSAILSNYVCRLSCPVCMHFCVWSRQKCYVTRQAASWQVNKMQRGECANGLAYFPYWLMDLRYWGAFFWPCQNTSCALMRCYGLWAPVVLLFSDAVSSPPRVHVSLVQIVRSHCMHSLSPGVP